MSCTVDLIMSYIPTGDLDLMFTSEEAPAVEGQGGLFDKTYWVSHTI